MLQNNKELKKYNFQKIQNVPEINGQIEGRRTVVVDY